MSVMKYRKNLKGKDHYKVSHRSGFFIDPLLNWRATQCLHERDIGIVLALFGIDQT